MAFTQSDLDAIRARIKRAELAVTFADRSTTYRPLDELRAIEAQIAASLQKKRAKQSLAVANKGF